MRARGQPGDERRSRWRACGPSPPSLPRVMAAPDDLDARGELLYGAYLVRRGARPAHRPGCTTRSPTSSAARSTSSTPTPTPSCCPTPWPSTAAVLPDEMARLAEALGVPARTRPARCATSPSPPRCRRRSPTLGLAARRPRRGRRPGGRRDHRQPAPRRPPATCSACSTGRSRAAGRRSPRPTVETDDHDKGAITSDIQQTRRGARWVGAACSPPAAARCRRGDPRCVRQGRRRSATDDGRRGSRRPERRPAVRRPGRGTTARRRGSTPPTGRSTSGIIGGGGGDGTIKIGWVSPATGGLAPFAAADDFIIGGIEEFARRRSDGRRHVVHGRDHPQGLRVGPRHRRFGGARADQRATRST